MAIHGYTAGERDRFGTQLNKLVFPSHPIDRIEHLYGRTKELDRIEKALFAEGRHIFIYGDRGVGKSSLAATAANQYQSADASYIDVGCAPNATLASIVANIALQAAKVSRINSVTKNASAGVKTRYFSVEAGVTEVSRNLHDEIRSVTDAVEVLREVSQVHSEKPVIVLDEFDRIQSADERSQFADLLKQLGDKRIPIKLIITGVGASLDALLGAHQSAIRQLETIELPRLGWEARWEIVQSVTDAFGITVNKNELIRIAAVSDGYPYYVHLISEKLMWHLFDEPQVVLQASKAHYQAAIRDAVYSVAAELKRPYEMAIKQRSGDYEEVLWSTADSDYLHRYPADMYSSYTYIMTKLQNKTPLDQDRYANRIRSLKKTSCGAILIPDPIVKGLYTYREKMLRGYVRMQAEANGIELIGEEAKATEKQYMHVSPRASSGYHQSTIPKGVHFGRKRQ
jgi:hypothetical protein